MNAPCQLTPVQVSADRVIRDVAGLRPFRPSGFRLETQQIGGKIVVHNYGHGGGGVTLSWGTAELAVEEIQRAGHKQYAVLGAGAVGLATACLLQQSGAEVTVYAKDLPAHTTSNIAGALFRPGTGFDPERATPAFFDRFEQAMHISHRRENNCRCVGSHSGRRACSQNGDAKYAWLARSGRRRPA